VEYSVTGAERRARTRRGECGVSSKVLTSVALRGTFLQWGTIDNTAFARGRMRAGAETLTRACVRSPSKRESSRDNRPEYKAENTKKKKLTLSVRSRPAARRLCPHPPTPPSDRAAGHSPREGPKPDTTFLKNPNEENTRTSNKITTTHPDRARSSGSSALVPTPAHTSIRACSRSLSKRR
jgi:hypothetical protein